MRVAQFVFALILQAAPGPPPAEEAAPVKPESDPFLARAREESEKFTESLPNYICQQWTTRYQSESRMTDFRALDVVSAGLVYEGGKESHRNIQINGRPLRKSVEDTGSWSYGEFGTTLKHLFEPGSPARFQFHKEERTANRTERVYTFHVDQPRSRWKVQIGSRSVYPEHKGSVWIDTRTHRVMRIEMEALNVPGSFPLDKVEWVVDYGWVRIGAAEHLIPVHAANLACWRSRRLCTMNEIEFRNYRRFSGESIIYTTDSTLEYKTGEEEKAPAKE